MEHLLAVLWEDYWRPWLKEKLEWLGYILLGTVLTAAVFLAIIWMEVETENMLAGW